MTGELLLHLTPPPQDPESKKPPLQLYGIFNAEKYKNLWVKLECEWKFKHASLFSDEALEVSMNSVAPYLVHMPITHPRISTLLKHYGHGGTLFFWSEEGFGKVLERMRDNFVIYSSDGSKGYFTFYRPSMFIEIMRESSPMLMHYIQGIKTYFCEDEYDPNILHVFHNINSKIKRHKIYLINTETI